MEHLAGVGAVVLLACLTASAIAAEGGGGGVLAGLRAGHPRVLVTPESLAALRREIEADGPRREVFLRLRKHVDGWMDEPPVRFEMIGPRLLQVSRRCVNHVLGCGLVYLVSGEKRYADRALADMAAAAAFRDWNPSHFLDTAEMTCALGIGYDWLHDVLSAEQRATLRRALVEKGLRPGLTCYRGEAPYGWWTKATHNWSQVCNGGLAIGALAVADEEPEVASEILASGLKAVRGAMDRFGRDGGWDEGPGYWAYTLRYTSQYLAALESALGSTFALDDPPGLAETGLFRIHFIGPTGRVFNFADANEGAGAAPAMFWLARQFDRPLYAWHQRGCLRGEATDVLWFTDQGRSPAETGLCPSKHFRGIDVAFLRSAWDDPEATWVGLRGGAFLNHAHLDLGSFCLDALGERWAVDLGRDDYNLPGYFGSERWTYYRLRTEGHNTLVLDGANQDTEARAPIVAFDGRSDGGSAVVDLSSAYPMARSVRRGVALAGGAVLVQDEVEADRPVDVVWSLHTRADVEADGRRAVLAIGRKRLVARVLAPEGARFEVTGAEAPPPQTPQPDVRKLVVRTPEKVRSLRLVVLLAPGGDADAEGPSFEPLEAWPGWYERP